MELSKHHKVLMSVAGLGVAALLVDNFVLAPPPPASAAEAVPVSSAAAASSPLAPAGATGLLPQAEGAADRIARLEGQQSSSNPPSSELLESAFGVPKAPVNFTPAEPNEAELKALAAGFKLTSVGGGLAVINGYTVGIGRPHEKLPDVILLSVTPPAGKAAASAEIEYQGVRLTITTNSGAPESHGPAKGR